jgi:hypothetical protein
MASAHRGRTRRPFASTQSNPTEWIAWTVVCVAILVLAIVIVRTAHTSPGYDPYGWLVWGYQGVHGTLSLAGAPSWKPITFLFTLPMALFGMHLEYWIWITFCLAVSMGGPVVGGRLVWRIVRPRSSTPIPALIGALFTAVAMVFIVGHDTSVLPYAHYVLSFQSDPMLVTFFLLAIDALMSRRYRWVHTWLLLVSLGRPEGWVILGPFALWAWFKQPQMRKFVVVELLIIPFMWFIVPVICGQPWNVAGNLAQNSPRELHGNKIVGVVDRYIDLTFWPVFAGAGVAVVYAAITRNRMVLFTVLAPVVWMICEIGFALHGWPAVARYMFEAGASTIVLGGIGVGLLVTWLFTRVPLPVRLASGALAVVLTVFLFPYARSQYRIEHVDLLGQKTRTENIALLNSTINALGGPQYINSCGVPTVDVGAASILSWYTHNDVADVGYIPKKQIKLGKPMVLFTGLYNGWVLHTYNQTGTKGASCTAKLDNTYFVTGVNGDPGGQVVHK